MVNYPEEGAIAAVDKLLELRELMEHGDPCGRDLATDALEVATRKLHREGLLDWFITRAANQQRYR
jgi:hypothetical protein